MFSKYFREMEKQLLKDMKTSGKGKAARPAAGKKTRAPAGHEEMREFFSRIIPSTLEVASVKITDPTGYVTGDADFVAYREYCRDIKKITGECIPSELVHGTFFVMDQVNRGTLPQVLDRVIQAKKINNYLGREPESPVIPAFVIATGSQYNFPDLKNNILEYYQSKGVDHDFEFDILAILGSGLIIKDWREKRKFVALETGFDTLIWFYILMNEYLEAFRNVSIDFRAYMRQSSKYNEY